LFILRATNRDVWQGAAAAAGPNPPAGQLLARPGDHDTVTSQVYTDVEEKSLFVTPVGDYMDRTVL
jgi:hypothetical protein